MSSITVARSSEGYVKPAEPTPPGTLALDWIGRYPTHRGLVDSIHIFKHGKEPAKVIREALAKTLVFYYPVAGRIVQTEGGGPIMLDCTGEGVWFVEAYADCTLEDVNYLERPMMIPQEDLVSNANLETSPADTIMMIQVTEFKCGGFVIGLRFNHASADGLGSAQFIYAMGEMARGLPEPSTMPVWERETYPNPSVKPAPLPDLPKMALEYVEVDFPASYISKLKDEYKQHTGKWGSTFDVLIARAWQCRARAVSAAPEVGIRMCFFASTRHILKTRKGYWGNSIFPVKVNATAGKITELSVVEIVDRIKEAKETMAKEVMKWARDEVTEDPFGMTFNYETIYVSDWTKLGFSEVDYGWGPAMYCGPFSNNEFIASCILLKSPAPLDGARLIARCVSNEHFDAFKELLTNID